MKFNVFDLYLFSTQKVSMYCPPINRERFEREFRNRHWPRNEVTKYCLNQTICVDKSEPSKLLWIFLRPTKVYKLVRDYHMVSNLNMSLQVLNIFILIYLFIKSLIYTMIIGSDKDVIKYLESIYYVHLAGVSKAPYIFNYLFLGYSFFFLLVKITRVRNMIKVSLKNAEEYKELNIAQVNSAYLDSFYLNLEEWMSLWKYINKHQRKQVNSQREIAICDHLKFNDSIQQILPTLSCRDALFFVNPIDFEKCFVDSVLSDYKERINRRKTNHLPFPADRISAYELKRIIILFLLRTCFITIGSIVSILSLIYLELKLEFPEDYSPSIKELIYAIPAHFLNPLYIMRLIETTLALASQIPAIHDISVVTTDIQMITSRASKLADLLEYHLRYILHQNRMNSSNDREWRARHFQTYFPSFNIIISGQSNSKQGLKKDSYAKYNKQIKHDLILARLLYREFLNVRNHHTEYLNIFVLGQAICVAYLIPVLMSQSISAEIHILTVALLSSLIPIVNALFNCARMERVVSYSTLSPS